MAFPMGVLPPQPFAHRAVAIPAPRSAIPAPVPAAAARRFTLLRMYCQGTAVFAVWLAALVFCGWALNIETLKSVLPGLVAMKPNTALGLAFAGISLWLLLPGETHTFRGRLARFLGFAVALIGAAVLLEYLFHLNLRIDELLFTEPRWTVGTYSPGRLSPLTAAAFVAMGTALSLLDWKTRRGHRPAQAFILLAMTIAMMVINGYIFRALAPDRILLGTQVALHTGIAIFLLSGAILFARPSDGITAYLTSEGSGSVMARRFLPAVFGVPIVLGWIRMQGQLAGLYGTELKLTLFCTSTIVGFGTLIWLSARQMNEEYEERRETEAVRERLAAVVESSGDAIITKTLQGIITAWNHGAETMFGYSAAEAIGQPMLMLIPEERAAEESSILERIRSGRLVDHFETVRVRKDGRKIDISATISPIRDSSGAIVGASKIARDITERRVAQEARLESDGRFQALANGVPQLAWMAAPDGGVVWYNQRWYDYTGTTPEQTMGWGWQSVHDPQVLPAVMERWTGAIAGGTTFEMEFPLRAADGSFSVFLTRVVPVKDPEGHVVRWFGTNTDISQRMQTDQRIEAQARELARSYEALERQTLMLQSVLDSITEGLVAVDEQGKFIIWNVMAEKLLGLGSTDLPAEQWNEHYGLFMNDTVTPFPTEQLPLVRALRAEVSRSEMFVRNSKIPEGTWIEVYAGPRYDKDRVLRGGVAAFRDVTKLKADEREIRMLNQKLEKRVAERTTQLEAANKHLAGHLTDQIHFKDEFLSHVSHELRSPLTAIKQFTSILLEGMAGALTAEQKEFLEIVFRNIVQLQAMIDDLLEISRMESGKLTMHPVTMSVLDAVTDACDTLRLSAAAKGVTLSWDPPSDLPSIIADPTRLRQILIILIDNAVKFTPPGGAIKIQVRSLPEDLQFLVVDVSDSGCGMSAEASNKVFERLYQVSDSGQTRKGLGLGLYICKELVVRQGGRIWVHSQPQVGSVFSFTVPVYSLGSLIAPLLKDKKWPTESIALLTVSTTFAGSQPSQQFTEEWTREVRDLVGLCLMPNLDVLLPRMKSGTAGEQSYVVAFADDNGASVLAQRIREEASNLPLSGHPGLSLSVSHTLLNLPPHNTAADWEHVVISVAAGVEDLIKSQMLQEGIHNEQQKSAGNRG